MLEPGMKVPDFTLHDANGNAVSLHDCASKAVVYDTFAVTMLIYGKEATTQIENSVPYYSVSSGAVTRKCCCSIFMPLK